MLKPTLAVDVRVLNDDCQMPGAIFHISHCAVADMRYSSVLSIAQVIEVSARKVSSYPSYSSRYENPIGNTLRHSPNAMTPSS